MLRVIPDYYRPSLQPLKSHVICLAVEFVFPLAITDFNECGLRGSFGCMEQALRSNKELPLTRKKVAQEAGLQDVPSTCSFEEAKLGPGSSTSSCTPFSEPYYLFSLGHYGDGPTLHSLPLDIVLIQLKDKARAHQGRARALDPAGAPNVAAFSHECHSSPHWPSSDVGSYQGTVVRNTAGPVSSCLPCFPFTGTTASTLPLDTVLIQLKLEGHNSEHALGRHAYGFSGGAERRSIQPRFCTIAQLPTLPRVFMYPRPASSGGGTLLVPPPRIIIAPRADLRSIQT
ncbi:hypothetical protein FB45DRAFT_1028422 [Roridomyces roridus]|uniref:Uncharacterized protein n=1 Tax=Roridomyces roridus TaxID=1738132 RepID=A0AAD7BQR0_9AGAR|nr:hypothetical protein FB45DRAFT_1028422 [Roridomyces roridus]